MTNRVKREGGGGGGVFGKTPHSDFLVLQEGERREREHPSFSLRSLEFRRWEFIKLRVKVHLLYEGYAYIPKMRDFTRDPKEEISRNQGFWAREASYPFYYASRGRDSSYSVSFPP